MRSAGIWYTRRSLVAAIIDSVMPGPGVLLSVPRTFEGRYALALHLAADPYLEVVAPLTLLRLDPIAQHLHTHHVAVWRVPDELLHAIIDLLQVRFCAATTLARVIARIPRTTLDNFLLSPVPDPRQLDLV